MKKISWRVIWHFISFSLILVGFALSIKGWPYGELLINIGFTPYVIIKLIDLLRTSRNEWHWTDTVRLALALFMGITLVLRYVHFYNHLFPNSNLYFFLALAMDYIVGRQLQVRSRNT